jgi:Phytanoyl-CoA dioxygenase (PhyH)
MVSTRGFDGGVVEQIREEGWAIVPDVLNAHEVRLAQEELSRLLPTNEEYESLTAGLPALESHDDDSFRYREAHSGGRSAAWQRRSLGSDTPFLTAFAVDQGVVSFATSLLGDTPILDTSYVSTKYARGQGSFEQGFHFDPLYAVYPRRSTPSFRLWVYLTDVTEETGATEIMPRSAARDDLSRFRSPTPDFCGFYTADDYPEVAGAAIPAVGNAGFALIYQARTHHRATTFAAASGWRAIAAYSYRAASRGWLSVSWDGDRGAGPVRPNFGRLSLQQRSALGFPPVGDPYWEDEEAIEEVERIFPEIDLAPYRH